MKRVALKRARALISNGRGLKRGGRLPQRSPKRLAETEDRAALRMRVLRRDGFQCQARLKLPRIRCGGPLDVHEVIPRSVWPGAHLVDSDCLTICRAHHSFVTDNPSEAAAVGLHGFSWERP